MNYRKYRNCFWALLLVAAILDSAYDVTALQSAAAAHAAAESLRGSLASLRQSARQTQGLFRNFEMAILNSEVDAERTISSNNISETQLFFATGLDFILLLTAALIWFAYDRNRRNQERGLEQAMSGAKKSNADLVRMLSERSSELRNTVHDLKNPLSAIMGFSELIKLDCNDPTSVMEKCDILKRVSDHMIELVNSLVERESHVENQAPRVMNLNAYIEDVCLALTPQSRSKHQQFIFNFATKNMQVLAHPRKIYDLLMNVVGNAIKFSPKNTKIKIRTKVKNGRAFFEVEDEGPGFSADDKLHAFEVFKTLSARPTGHEKSSGLGLSIVREIAEYHGGSVKIEDAPSGHGACVVVELPA